MLGLTRCVALYLLHVASGLWLCHVFVYVLFNPLQESHTLVCVLTAGLSLLNMHLTADVGHLYCVCFFGSFFFRTSTKETSFRTCSCHTTQLTDIGRSLYFLNLLVLDSTATCFCFLWYIKPAPSCLALVQFVKFANIEEDTPSYHRSYDFFVSRFSEMCHSEHNDLDVQNKSVLLRVSSAVASHQHSSAPGLIFT